jgi:glutamine amidotransferase
MIAIIDVSGTNLTSLSNAIRRLGFNPILTHDEELIHQSSHVILPGVGTAQYGMRALKDHGLIEVLLSLKQPVLGICLGMQLLLEASEEGDVCCLGLIPGVVKRLIPQKDFPVPHMGWNSLLWLNPCRLQQGLEHDEYFYFVHSFALNKSAYTLAECTYRDAFCAVINKNNVYGMQFHPEKSGNSGAKLLNNFLSLETSC